MLNVVFVVSTNDCEWIVQFHLSIKSKIPILGRKVYVYYTLYDWLLGIWLCTQLFLNNGETWETIILLTYTRHDIDKNGICKISIGRKHVFSDPKNHGM